MGTACHENYIALLGFSRADKRVRTPREGWCFTEASPLSPDNPIPGDECAPNKEKRTLPRTLADVSEVGCVTAPDTNQPRPDCINLRGQGREY